MLSITGPPSTWIYGQPLLLRLFLLFDHHPAVPRPPIDRQEMIKQLTSKCHRTCELFSQRQHQQQQEKKNWTQKHAVFQCSGRDLYLSVHLLLVGVVLRQGDKVMGLLPQPMILSARPIVTNFVKYRGSCHRFERRKSRGIHLVYRWQKQSSDNDNDNQPSHCLLTRMEWMTGKVRCNERALKLWEEWSGGGGIGRHIEESPREDPLTVAVGAASVL